MLTPAYLLPDGTFVSCLPSIGSADSREHSTAADLLAAADAAMYRAKREHRAARDATAPGALNRRGGVRRHGPG